LAGDEENAISEFKYAAAHTTNLREQHYLTTKAAQLGARQRRSLAAGPGAASPDQRGI
jgi:hypothetical protein